MMKIILPLILLLLVATLVATAQPAVHSAAGPGSSPSTMALANEARALLVERDALKAENAALKLRIKNLEDIVASLTWNRGLREPSSSPSVNQPASSSP